MTPETHQRLTEHAPALLATLYLLLHTCGQVRGNGQDPQTLAGVEEEAWELIARIEGREVAR